VGNTRGAREKVGDGMGAGRAEEKLVKGAGITTYRMSQTPSWGKGIEGGRA